ncbi:MAG: hypothetical protein OXT74_04450 [Candidatus Poribacteria bacterium]|nr:hypothetical protein [Candidatus Poribacteria bacterium]
MVLDDRLYVAGRKSLGKWNEAQQVWEHLSQELPADYSNTPILTLAVNRGRIIAGVYNRGVWVFDARSETWITTGLDGLTVSSLVSHYSDLYAETEEGIYRASIPTVQPYGKFVAIWGAIKGGPKP